MPQMGFGGMGGYGMPQMGYGGGFGGYGGFGGMGGYGMPQMGYGGYGGFGGFGMPQMGYGLGSFGPQMGFGGYGNYGGFQPDMSYGGQFDPRAMPDLVPRPTRKPNEPPPGMVKNPHYIDRFSDGSIQTMDMRFTDNPFVSPERLSQFEKEQEESRARYATANPITGVMPSEPIPAPGDAPIADETGQYDPNRGASGSGSVAPTYSEPAPPVMSPIQPNKPRRMTNSMNMGIGSFFGGIGPSNFGNFY